MVFECLFITFISVLSHLSIDTPLLPTKDVRIRIYTELLPTLDVLNSVILSLIYITFTTTTKISFLLQQ